MSTKAIESTRNCYILDRGINKQLQYEDSKMINVLVTGTSGYVGQQIIAKLVSDKFENRAQIGNVVALDVVEPKNKIPGVTYYVEDIRSEKMSQIFKENEITAVIHMAAVINPTPRIPVDMMYSINVDGTRNLINACIENNVNTFSFASSGAAYGYHADNAKWLKETDKIRGEERFPYSLQKRVNEEDLQKLAKTNPEIKQFTFRIGTVLGTMVNNPITDLFNKKVIMGVKGSETPFVFIWDHDLMEIFIQSLFSVKPGIYNVAGDGSMSLSLIAKRIGKINIKLPEVIIRNALKALNNLGVIGYGADQVLFLKHRPVLLNTKLKEEFGYIPKKTTNEVFEYYLENRIYS